MFNHKLHEQASLKTYFDWFLLSFLAGNINTGGFLSCGRFVSHVTGFSTLVGVSFAEGDVLKAVGLLSIPCYFLAGVMVSAYLTEKNRSDEIHDHRYAPVMGIAAACLALVTIGGSLRMFGVFGEPANLGHDYFLLALLCGACGLQNAAITSASGHTIRTTHLTGLTTDLGIGIIRAEIHHGNPESRNSERKSNLLRVATIVAFTLGSAVGAIVYLRFGYFGFILPTIIAIYASISARRKK